MIDDPAENWSPADNPYAIAVSQAQWWKESARLAILRMRRNDDARFGWFSAQQIDARQLVVALHQLLSAEDLEQFALEELGIDLAIRDTLARARHRFEDALPGVKDMRDGLVHFEEWSRGMGRGPQQIQRNNGVLPRDVARHFWGFGFDPNAGTVSFGPHTIDLDMAERAAAELCQAIWSAAHQVDRRNTAEVRAKTIAALVAAGIRTGVPDAGFKVSPGDDLRIWVSLDRTPGAPETGYSDLAAGLVAALTAAGLRVVSNLDAEDGAVVVRLVRGEMLYVVADTCEPEGLEAETLTEVVTQAQIQRCVALAVEKLREAERCADAESFEAACAMVGAAVESALTAQVGVSQPEVRAANLWRKRRGRKKNAEEDKSLFDWTLDELIQVAVKMEWLPITGGGLSGAEPIDKLAGEVGDAVRFIQEVRNLVVHPGKYLRGDYWPTIGRIEYDVVNGIARTVLSHLYEEIQRLDAS